MEVPPIDDCPDGVFVEDTMVVFGDLAVIARAGADERRPEAAEAEQAVAAQGYRIAHITEPGTLDGGDILKIGTTVYAGLGGRTNQAGIDQLRRSLRATRSRRGRSTGSEGSAPEVGGDRVAGRHGDRVRATHG